MYFQRCILQPGRCANVCVDNIKNTQTQPDSSRVRVWPRLRDFNIVDQCANDVCALITCFTSQALSCHL